MRVSRDAILNVLKNREVFAQQEISFGEKPHGRGQQFSHESMSGEHLVVTIVFVEIIVCQDNRHWVASCSGAKLSSTSFPNQPVDPN